MLKTPMASSVDPDQTVPIGAVCSGSTLFASILNLSVMLGNYLQQMTFSDAFFFLALKETISLDGQIYINRGRRLSFPNHILFPSSIVYFNLSKQCRPR